MKSKLPEKPSALIKVALKDLAKIERSRKYKVNMGFWHRTAPGKKAKCEVCLGGSVLAKTLKVPFRQTLQTHEIGVEYGQDVGQKIIALDRFRRGQLMNGLQEMGLRGLVGDKYYKKFGTYFPEITAYEYDPKKFKEDMLQLAKNLKKIGY